MLSLRSCAVHSAAACGAGRVPQIGGKGEPLKGNALLDELLGNLATSQAVIGNKITRGNASESVMVQALRANERMLQARPG